MGLFNDALKAVGSAAGETLQLAAEDAILARGQERKEQRLMERAKVERGWRKEDETDRRSWEVSESDRQFGRQQGESDRLFDRSQGAYDRVVSGDTGSYMVNPKGGVKKLTDPETGKPIASTKDKKLDPIVKARLDMIGDRIEANEKARAALDPTYDKEQIDALDKNIGSLHKQWEAAAGGKSAPSGADGKPKKGDFTEEATGLNPKALSAIKNAGGKPVRGRSGRLYVWKDGKVWTTK